MQLAHMTFQMLLLNIIKNSKSERLLGRNNFFNCIILVPYEEMRMVTLYGT